MNFAKCRFQISFKREHQLISLILAGIFVFLAKCADFKFSMVDLYFGSSIYQKPFVPPLQQFVLNEGSYHNQIFSHPLVYQVVQHLTQNLCRNSPNFLPKHILSMTDLKTEFLLETFFMIFMHCNPKIDPHPRKDESHLEDAKSLFHNCQNLALHF